VHEARPNLKSFVRLRGHRASCFSSVAPPLVRQWLHLTVWTLWGLFTDLNVVSIVFTLMPQLESCGWHVVHDARVVWRCFSWQAKQLSPSWTPMAV
jgi:hypothetical protein